MDRGTTFDRARRRLPDHSSVAYDRRGYANSTHLPIGSDPFADHVNDLVAILNELPTTVGHPVVEVVLVGHSAGSNVVFAAAPRRTEVVATVTFEPPMPWLDWWPGHAGGSTLAVFESEGPEAAAEAFMRRIVGDQVWERLPAATQAARRAEGPALVADLTTLRGRGAQFNHHDLSVARIASVVGRGERSQPHQRRSSEVAVELLGNVGTLVDIAGASHGAHGSHPGEFAALVDLALEHAVMHGKTGQ
jgi:pimeloyl-ACP methyl ester carboxylesterase